ncbi:uncharacterized protein BCR38DRAFT_434792 [Pseudomassariella vexata]|uniref:Uncharacterized protein n=1 Tax=Pseudomassariella vexata TaxID=1141098 RepID=A0A1Y2DYI2_9PEZI|nr:uncharacterized protein BCR38DRAFT_434792 [Pseudomassariella vexata]ORY64313.1 hypothetical protein BCR38DRAFT_434792 [Pseudomassariella vexata]
MRRWSSPLPVCVDRVHAMLVVSMSNANLFLEKLTVSHNDMTAGEGYGSWCTCNGITKSRSVCITGRSHRITRLPRIIPIVTCGLLCRPHGGAAHNRSPSTGIKHRGEFGR